MILWLICLFCCLHYILKCALQIKIILLLLLLCCSSQPHVHLHCNQKCRASDNTLTRLIRKKCFWCRRSPHGAFSRERERSSTWPMIFHWDYMNCTPVHVHCMEGLECVKIFVMYKVRGPKGGWEWSLWGTARQWAHWGNITRDYWNSSVVKDDLNQTNAVSQIPLFNTTQ